MGSSRRRALNGMALLACGALACGRESQQPRRVVQALEHGRERPDEAPRLITADIPFRYPVALYARKVQGNVMLRLYIDENGTATPDSTRVESSSGYPALDSAALTGAHELRFVPAKLRGEPLPLEVMFPVYFRHPEARPLPGDTILSKRGLTP